MRGGTNEQAKKLPKLPYYSPSVQVGSLIEQSTIPENGFREFEQKEKSKCTDL